MRYGYKVSIVMKKTEECIVYRNVTSFSITSSSLIVNSTILRKNASVKAKDIEELVCVDERGASMEFEELKKWGD